VNGSLEIDVTPEQTRLEWKLNGEHMLAEVKSGPDHRWALYVDGVEEWTVISTDAAWEGRGRLEADARNLVFARITQSIQRASQEQHGTETA
jgi:hypothetical protein